MAAHSVKIISVCSGIGGLDLGVHRALEGLGLRPQPVCYVEREGFGAATLVARMESEELGEAPVWSDLLTFPAEEFAGQVDLLVGGIPCQPHSLAGKQKGLADPRDLWPVYLDVADRLGVEWLLLENVQGFYRALPRVLADLAKGGWDAEWSSLRASDVGAPHRRRRVFLLAHRKRNGQQGESTGGAGSRIPHGDDADRRSTGVADAICEGLEGREEFGGNGHPEQQAAQRGGAVPHAFGHGVRKEQVGEQGGQHQAIPQFPPPRGVDFDYPDGLEPSVCRVADGVPTGLDGPFRTDRLKALGNSVVPQQAEAAFRELLLRFLEN